MTLTRGERWYLGIIFVFFQPQTHSDAEQENPENQQSEMPGRQPQKDDGREAMGVHCRGEEGGDWSPFPPQPKHIPEDYPHEYGILDSPMAKCPDTGIPNNVVPL